MPTSLRSGFLKKTEKRYSLPTEAQWEYAAKGGNRSQGKTYAGSNSLGLVGWFFTNSGNQTHAVGQKQPNELGIYDMSGNVLEWCHDWFASNYYSQSPANNPVNQEVGDRLNRVLRGGSWVDDPFLCRSAHRGAHELNKCLDYVGFRLVSQ